MFPSAWLAPRSGQAPGLCRFHHSDFHPSAAGTTPLVPRGETSHVQPCLLRSLDAGMSN